MVARRGDLDAGACDVDVPLYPFSKRNIFEEKRRCIHIIGAETEGRASESVNLSTADNWQ